LERRVRQHSSRPKSTEELVSVLQEEWLNIDLEYLKKLVISMPKRVQVVIKNKGYLTKY